MTTISNLPRDLVEEILSRVPLIYLKRLRSTCKKWNVLSKDDAFTKKHLAQAAAREDEFLAIVMINCSLCLINLQIGVHNNEFDLTTTFIRPRGKLISLHDTDELEITGVCHCEGLLLCPTKEHTRLVIWNPYSGQTRWICGEPKPVDLCINYTLGYEEGKSCRTYKILRFCRRRIRVDGRGYGAHEYYFYWGRPVYEMYDGNSNSWRVLDVNPYWIIDYPNFGVSLKGNTYGFACHIKPHGNFFPDFLLCFDFTAESFGQRLPLPYDHHDALMLSSVREEQLAVLLQHRETYEMEVWITTKIEPNAVSWSKFLAVDMAPLTGFRFSINGSFLVIDEERRCVVVFDKDNNLYGIRRNTAYLIGGNGSFREMDLGDINSSFFPYALSYVPSSVQINHLA